MPRSLMVAGLFLLPLLAGCQRGQYDKDLRLYLQSGEPLVAGRMEAGGWYVVGARMPDARFRELGIRFPADPGERLELRREGEAILASAAGYVVPVDNVPSNAVYVAWARQYDADSPVHDVPRGRRRAARDFNLVGALIEGVIRSLFDRDDDHEDRGKADDEDRGRRYKRPDGSDDRKRTRDTPDNS